MILELTRSKSNHREVSVTPFLFSVVAEGIENEETRITKVKPQNKVNLAPGMNKIQQDH